MAKIQLYLYNKSNFLRDPKIKNPDNILDSLSGDKILMPSLLRISTASGG